MSRSRTSADDDLVFLEETADVTGSTGRPTGQPVWRVMIVDDDVDVHSATMFALANLEMQHRPLEFLHAYSAAQARDLLACEQDIAVILLDVVMEQGESGLQLVRHIREVLKLSEVRIILRTGQPGYAPEIDAIRDFDINDYKTKSELTRIKLYTTVTAAIRSYEQICAINASRRGLDRIARASSELMALHGLDSFAAGVLSQVARLLDLPPNGLLCRHEKSDNLGQELLSVAALGPHAGLLNKPICALSSAHIAGAMQAALRERRHVYGDDFAALYLGGNASAEFVAFFDTGKVLGEIEQQLLNVFCRNIAVGLDNVLLMSRLHTSAFYDPLTKLPNRTRLREMLDATLAAPSRPEATLALVDIDHFAETNDALGHQFGDSLLLGVAARLQSELGEQLVVGRVGGDTFSVLGNAALVNPNVILNLFDKPFRIDGQEVQLSATAGLVNLHDYDGCGADALKDADIALKRAKLLQRAGHFYFSRSMGVDIRERVRLMHALRSALEAKELFVVYQPQIDLATRRPVGAEALLRWKTKDGTFIAPDRFIPIAEYSGLIIEIGEQVMRVACEELVRLQALGFTDFTMSVNVSQVQFRHPRFLDTLRNVLADTGAPASRIELEITESIAMEEPDALIELLGKIKQIGVSIAIDDFGTGFSSLSYLQRLQADRLKIDRGFVTEITSSARGSSIAEMVIQLGRNLGLSVVAEGVEDDRQAQILAALGCPLAQGYLFARPMPADQLQKWLAHHAA
ncbi:putative bifunctional diguanylate cyclase/phosphodiesterase [Noviherbaspirillum autotrophicum]|uniref:Signal peptide protein n=1 Tax=Noviherbaspirillum autotrophicum TaxID=709839 RepID=A0A0C1YNT4_9BURK|nr:EAL domain-containing protein [Noviherbaspirillum autotrophicum]KIF82252.1 signal peptide protein [Noviherbaspirillum autotrophicum]